MTPVNGYRHPLSPRYLEVDRQGVVFNMWYLAYFDDALAGCFAAGGLPYSQLLAGGYDVSLVHTELHWTAGLAYGESAEIVVGVESVGRTSFTLTFDVLRARVTDQLTDQMTDQVSLCRGRTVYVVVADDGSGKREIPSRLRQVLAVMQDAGQGTPPA